MKRSKVWYTFANSKPSTILDIVTESISSKLQVKESAGLKAILQNEYRRYQKHVANQRKLKAEDRQQITGEDKIVVSRVMLNEENEDDPDCNEEGEPVAKKTFYKPFVNLSSYRKRCRTEELFDLLKCFIEH